MGGHDVYSTPKGAAELIVASYRRSFFPPSKLGEHGIAVAGARAGTSSVAATGRRTGSCRTP